jgi:hypothetical protein
MKLHDSQQTFNKPSDDPAPIVQTSLLGSCTTMASSHLISSL